MLKDDRPIRCTHSRLPCRATDVADGPFASRLPHPLTGPLSTIPDTTDRELRARGELSRFVGSRSRPQGGEPVARNANLDRLTLSRRLCRQAIMATRLARAHLCWCRRERPGSVWKFAAESSWAPQGVLKLCNSGALVRTAGCAGISQCLPRHWNLLVLPTSTDRAHLACFYPAIKRMGFVAALWRNVA
jgi:hypothetical protein